MKKTKKARRETFTSGDYKYRLLDEAKNETVMGQETEIGAPESRTKIWVIPTNEEIIVARQTMAKLAERN